MRHKILLIIEMTEKIKPKKSLGQNFLVNEYTINTISEIINLYERDLVLEVGPLQGALTKNIIGKTKHYIGIEKDRIITKDLDNSTSKEIIDGINKIICPGFIDVHSHDDFRVVNDKRILHNLCQGITTMIVGNCGFGVSPITPAKEQMSSLYQVSKLDNEWKNFGE